MDCDGCDEVVGVDASWPCSDDGDPNDGGAGPDEEEWFADSHADVEGWLYAVSLTDEEPCEGIDDDGAESGADAVLALSKEPWWSMAQDA